MPRSLVSDNVVKTFLSQVTEQNIIKLAAVGAKVILTRAYKRLGGLTEQDVADLAANPIISRRAAAGSLARRHVTVIESYMINQLQQGKVQPDAFLEDTANTKQQIQEELAEDNYSTINFIRGEMNLKPIGLDA